MRIMYICMYVYVHVLKIFLSTINNLIGRELCKVLPTKVGLFSYVAYMYNNRHTTGIYKVWLPKF